MSKRITDIGADGEPERPGRPPLLQEERRGEVVQARVTAAEKRQIEAKAEAAGLSVSEHLRRVAQGRQTAPRVAAKRRHVLRRLGLRLRRAAARDDVGAGARGEIEAVADALHAMLFGGGGRSGESDADHTVKSREAAAGGER